MNVRKVLAKGEIIEIEDEEGKKEFKIYPLSNRQLLEIQELSKKKDEPDFDAIGLMIILLQYSQLKPNYAGEECFTDEELKDFPTPFLLKLLKDILKLNGLEDMMDFQQKSQAGRPTLIPSQPASKNDIFQVLNQNPAKKLG